MTEPRFIHLRAHTSFSLAEGAILPKYLVELCKIHNMPAVGVTESANLFSSLEFSQAASNAGIQPIIGTTIIVRDVAEAKSLNRQSENYHKLVLLAKDEIGYQNLLYLSSQSYLEGERAADPFITYDDLYTKQKGLIVLTGAMQGPIAAHILQGQNQKAEMLLLELKKHFVDRLYVELARLGIEQEEEVEQALVDLAYQHDIPLVATNDVLFATKDMHTAHDALLCIAHGRFVDEEARPKVTAEHYFKSQQEMCDLFEDLPEALENTLVIAKRCAVMSQGRKPILPHFDCGEGLSEAEELKKMAHAGLKSRLEKTLYEDDWDDAKKEEATKPYLERLDYELGIIVDMQFPGYFLIVSDFIKWSKRNSVPVGPGRGSGAGSVVAWALEITDLDPLKLGLLFERFLNPERVSMPDFDIDFCQEKRDKTIRYVQEKYGKDKVAQIITFGKLQARAVLRDVGRVLQLPYNQVDRICKMIPFNPIDPVTLSKAIEMDEELQKERDSDADIKHLIDIALKLEGLNRHASTHAAGVVIADRPLYELIPVYRDPRSEMPVTGYSMKYAEGAGLVKFDFLGLKTLTVIAKACEFIEAKGEKIDISTIPMDDRQTFEMLGRGDSVGVFQLESAGMRDTLRKLKPDNFEDIIALISLYRPGPMDNIPNYIARKHGKEDPDYLHPMLENILKETYGVIIYQEQVMQIAQTMGGYSLGAADLLRRAMGKKIASEMDAQREIFVKGAEANKVNKAQASSIFDLVAKFAGYGFNKSHAAAYALISYQTAYLKAKYPVEFLAASLNLDIQDTDKISVFVREALDQGITVLPPDVNASFADFRPENYHNPETEKEEGAIRYALGALKNVGIAAMSEVVGERQSKGKFSDLTDFISRVGSSVINKRQLENLARAGAFDCIHENRKQIYESVEALGHFGATIERERNSKQASLFGDDDSWQKASVPKLANVKDWNHTEQLQEEFGAVGFYLTGHPLAAHEDALKRMHVIYADAVHESGGYKLAGVVNSKRIRSSAKGKFATVMLSDPSGIFEVSIFDEELLAASRDVLEAGVQVVLSVDARKDEGGVRMIAKTVQTFESIFDKQKLNVQIELEDFTVTPSLRELFTHGESKGNKIHIIAPLDGHKVTVALPDGYGLPLGQMAALQSADGVVDVATV